MIGTIRSTVGFHVAGRLLENVKARDPTKFLVLSGIDVGLCNCPNRCNHLKVVTIVIFLIVLDCPK